MNADTDVVIIGAGPVGLTLALDLAWRGVDVTVAEARPRGAPPPAKCNHVSARSMEIFRRLGVAGKLRNAGLPPDYPNDVSYRTTFTGTELARISIPCRRDRYFAKDGPDTGWPTPEPPHRINQIYLEPILFDHAAQAPRIRMLSETRYVEHSPAPDGVATKLFDERSGRTISLSSRFLIGCDGGRSQVRKDIGAELQGDPVVQRCQSSLIRAPDLLRRAASAPAWGTFSLNPRRPGNCYAIDGASLWVIHNYLRDDEADFDAVDRDHGIRTILGVGSDFDYEVIAHEDWYGRRLVADRFRKDRVFICGDAAHIWVPYAGYGMNAGIADAANLSWLLAANINGWGADAIIDAYEAERQPITEQVSHFVMNHAHAMAQQRRQVPANIEDDDDAGARARQELGQHAYDLNVQQYCAAGLNFGYFYDDSPIIRHEPETAPGYTMSTFTASTLPGCRTPHCFFADGRSLYDALGPEYTLIRLDPEIEVAPLVDESRALGFPLDIVDLPADEADAAYQHKLVLSRPDQHVAWRGDTLPDDVRALIYHLSARA